MAENKYLDSAGLSILWNQVKAEDAKIQMNYDSSQQKITFTDHTGMVTTEVDCNQFIKDGMLKDVSISTPEKLGYPIVYNGVTYSHLEEETKNVQFLVFTWNIADAEGDENSTHAGVKVDFLKIDEFAKVYDADGKSIELVGNTFSVKEVKADKTTTLNDIPAVGGPLASFVAQVPEFKDGIPAGTTMQEVLEKLIFVAKWPENITEVPATLTSAVASPIITMNDDRVEVGTTVHYSVSNGASKSVAVPSKVTGLTYGYATDEKGPRVSTEDIVSSKFGEINPANNTTTLTVTAPDSKDNSNPKTQPFQGTSTSAELASGDIVAILGPNTVSATNTSATYTGTCEVLKPVYGCSNNGKTDSSHVSKEIPEKTLTSTSVTSKEVSKSFQGDYYWYVGYAATVPTSTEGIKALAASKKFLGEGKTTGAGKLPANNYMCIAVPVGHKLVHVLNDMGQENTENFITPENITTVQYALANGSLINYTIYVMHSTANWAYNEVKIN